MHVVHRHETNEALLHCAHVNLSRQTLAAARKLRTPNAATKIMDLNPKSIKTEELYGFISMATREWKDGLLSKVMPGFAQSNGSGNLVQCRGSYRFSCGNDRCLVSRFEDAKQMIMSSPKVV